MSEKDVAQSIQKLRSHLKCKDLDTIASTQVPDQECFEFSLCQMPIHNTKQPEPARSFNECLGTFKASEFIKSGISYAQLFG